jgi:RluA family pseudouridine synthase
MRPIHCAPEVALHPCLLLWKRWLDLPTVFGFNQPMKPREWIVPAQSKGLTLQDFLAASTGLSRNHAKRLIDERRVFVNGRRIWMSRHPLKPRDRIEFFAVEAAKPADFKPQFLYEDDDYLVLNKPAGLETTGETGIESLLRSARKTADLKVVHRLDRDTSGCLMVARSATAFDAILPLFKDQRILKLYHAVVRGTVEPREQVIREPLDGQAAVTHLRVLDSNPQASHLRVKIETGRTHQIRRHLLFLRHPLVGDSAYGTRKVLPDALRRVARQMLHAAVLEFPHPVLNKKIRVEAELPPDFKACLKSLHLS